MSKPLTMSALFDWHIDQAAAAALDHQKALAKAAAYRSGSLIYASAGGSPAQAIHHDGIAAACAVAEAFHTDAATLLHSAAMAEAA